MEKVATLKSGKNFFSPPIPIPQRGETGGDYGENSNTPPKKTSLSMNTLNTIQALKKPYKKSLILGYICEKDPNFIPPLEIFLKNGNISGGFTPPIKRKS